MAFFDGIRHFLPRNVLDTDYANEDEVVFLDLEDPLFVFLL